LTARNLHYPQKKDNDKRFLPNQILGVNNASPNHLPKEPFKNLLGLFQTNEIASVTGPKNEQPLQSGKTSNGRTSFPSNRSVAAEAETNLESGMHRIIHPRGAR
jgi:hypothetical protein